MTACADFDVLVVGGGPAGSSLAWGLRGSGLRVGIMDKANFPRHKVCAGWVTPAVIEALGLDLADYARQHVLQPITGFRIGVAGQDDEVSVTATENGLPVSYGIRRYEFDDYLLRRCGAEMLLRQPCRSISPINGGWRVNGHLRAAVLVGAGGHFCPVARHLGARPGQGECTVTAQEQEIPLSDSQQRQCAISEESPALYFCDDLRGYGWVFRKGAWLNIGLGREDSRRLPERLAEFRDWLVDTGRIPSGLPSEVAGHAYLLSGHATRPLTGQCLLLIGDAAGLAYPQSGEGIRPAVESGLLAANVLASRRGRFDADAALEFIATVEERFGPRATKLPAPASGTAGFKAAIGRSLLRLPWFDRHVVVDRWFLRRHVPALSQRPA